LTKSVRVENADTSPYGISVEVWDKGVDEAPDVLAHVVPLDFPTAQANLGITSTRYLVIKETKPN